MAMLGGAWQVAGPHFLPTVASQSIKSISESTVAASFM
jgi:hypothetical protein